MRKYAANFGQISTNDGQHGPKSGEIGPDLLKSGLMLAKFDENWQVLVRVCRRCVGITHKMLRRGLVE